MNNYKKAFWAISVVVLSTISSFATVTLNVHNCTGSPDVFLYLNTPADKVTGLNSIDGNFKAQTYEYPFKKDGKDGSGTYTIRFDTINSGNLNFGILGNDHIPVIPKGENHHPLIGATSDAYTGFIEFSYIKPAIGKGNVYWDLSNVDQVGMLCGMQSNDNRFTTAGYKFDGANFVSGLTSALSKKSVNTRSVEKKCGPGGKYTKILGPTLTPKAYSTMYANYLSELKNAGAGVILDSDSLPNPTKPYKDWKENNWDSSKFTGEFLESPMLIPILKLNEKA